MISTFGPEWMIPSFIVLYRTDDANLVVSVVVNGRPK